MTIKSLLAFSILSLATTTAAVADVSVRVEGHLNTRVIRPRVTQPPRQVSHPRIDRAAQFSVYEGWIGRVQGHGDVVLTQPTHILIGREHFDVTNAGRISSITLEAVAGSTSITVVGVGYVNGTSEQFQVNQRIDARRNAAVTLDVRGRSRQILWINVNGESGGRSSYRLLASS
ncbi:MAG: hypothetical protein NT062_23070 [Proteobacteria bacterium]|nr:hypothetical protein [Pseudomonadota bacterium]